MSNTESPVRRWHAHAPIIVDDFVHGIMHSHAPVPPADNGIRYADDQPDAASGTRTTR